jgi:transcriptional regulator with XRE-family HTH domain
MRVNAETLRHHRLRQALTQKELAEAAGVSYVTISRMENGQGGPVKPPTLRKISNALGLTPETLIEWGTTNDEGEAKKRAA